MKEYAKYLQENMNEVSPVGVVRQTITTKFDTPYVTMAEAIAERFGETRIAVLQKVIEEGIRSLYFSFDPEHRAELAKVADKKTTDFMISKGASCKNVGVLGALENEWIDWQMQEYSFLLNAQVLEILKNDPSMNQSDAIQLAHPEVISKFEGKK